MGRAAASLRYRSLDDIVADFDTEMEQLQRVTVAVSRALKSTYFEPGT